MQPRPLVPWIGGKRRLVKHILPLFPEHTCYCEPCSGAAALFFAKQPSEVEVLNDVNGDIVNLYRVVQHHMEEFTRHFRHSLVSRQMFNWLKETPPGTLTDIQRAARFFYLQKMAFGAVVHKQHFGVAATAPPRLNLLRIEEDISAAHLRLCRAFIEQMNWQECVRRYDREGTLFYVDPPYWGTTGYGVDFGMEQYVAMADAARTIKGKMIISVNDIPEMREVFDGLDMRSVGIRYSVDNSAKATSELIIKNW